MSSDRSWTSIILRAMLYLGLLFFLFFFFLSFQTLLLCLASSRGSDSCQSISKECEKKEWAVGGWTHQCVTMTIHHWMASEVCFFNSWKNYTRPESWSNIMHFLTHTWAEPPQSSLETLPGVGAGRRSCCTIRLDSELMGLPRRPGPVLYLPTYTASVWKRPPKASSLSPHMSWS